MCCGSAGYVVCWLSSKFADIYLLMQCGYQLHAVLVHEGQAASGHYWAYIYCPMNNEWLKFNDVTVEKASWEDVQKDGVGDYHNTSAYCIMYVNRNHPDFHQVASLCGEQ